jgi:hypothetical protein
VKIVLVFRKQVSDKIADGGNAAAGAVFLHTREYCITRATTKSRRNRPKGAQASADMCATASVSWHRRRLARQCHACSRHNIP